MRCKNLKVFGFLLSSTLSMSCLGGCGESSNYNPAIYNQEQGITMSKRFETGEHYISVPLPNDISDKITQIESPEGYKVISLSYGSYGEICGFYILTMFQLYVKVIYMAMMKCHILILVHQ